MLAEVTETDPSTVESALGELIGRRLVHRVGGDPGAHEFSHELVARVTVERLLPARRKHLHLMAARLGASTVSAGRRGRRPVPCCAGGIFGDPKLGVVESSGQVCGSRSVSSRWWRHWWGWDRSGAPHSVPCSPVGLPACCPTASSWPRSVNLTGDSALGAVGDMAADWIARGLTQTTAFEVVDPRTAWITSRLVARIPRLLRPRGAGRRHRGRDRRGTGPVRSLLSRARQPAVRRSREFGPPGGR